MAKITCLFLTIIFGFVYPTLSIAQQNEHEGKIDPDDPLMRDLTEASLISLLDFDVELNPDWQAKSPTKLNQKASESPANVQVISKDQILQFGYQQLSEVLSHVAGFVATSDLTLTNFGARGIHPGTRAGSRVIKVMLDGQPIAYRANQQNWIDRNLIPIQLVERIEIIKGPASALYGANAFMGVVNVVTQNGDDIKIKGHLASLEFSSAIHAGNGSQFSYIGGEQSTDWNTVYGFSYGQYDRAGLTLPVSSPLYSDLSQDDSRMLSAETDESSPSVLYFKSRRNFESDGLTQNGYWQVGLHYQELNEHQAFSDTSPLFKTGINQIHLYNSFINTELSLPISESLTFNSKLAYSKGAPKTDDRVEIGAEHFYYTRDWGYSAVDFNAELSWNISNENLWLFGIEFNDEQHQLESFDRVERDSGATSQVSDTGKQRFHNWSFYTQWLYRLSSQINSIAGFRYDKHDVYSAQSSSRIGLAWSLANQQYFKLLFGSSFQSPTAELLYRMPVVGGDIIGNPDLQPQKAKTIELIYGGLYEKTIRYDATLYWTQVTDLVKYANNLTNLVAKNATRSKTTGLELNAAYKSDEWHIYTNLSWQKTKIDATSPFILENRDNGELFPELSFNFGISYQNAGQEISLNNQYVGKRPVSSTNVIAAETFYDASDYLNSILVLQKRLYLLKNKETRLQFKINDLWDEQFAYPGFGGIDVPSLGRTFSLAIEQRF